MEATLNYLGSPIDSGDIGKFLNGDVPPELQALKMQIDAFFGVPSEKLNEEILARYAKVTTKDLYLGIMPHDNQILENLLTPHKSAKRCFCFAEYLATIELSAHISEMLSVLLTLIYPIKINSQEIDCDVEKKLFGTTFKKINQERRLSVLLSFGIIDTTTHKKFNDIREIRRKYFHLWDHSKKNIESDAYTCFCDITFLIKSIVEIKINNSPPPPYLINTALKDYIKRKESDSPKRK